MPILKNNENEMSKVWIVWPIETSRDDFLRLKVTEKKGEETAWTMKKGERSNVVCATFIHLYNFYSTVFLIYPG